MQGHCVIGRAHNHRSSAACERRAIVSRTVFPPFLLARQFPRHLLRRTRGFSSMDSSRLAFPRYLVGLSSRCYFLSLFASFILRFFLSSFLSLRSSVPTADFSLPTDSSHRRDHREIVKAMEDRHRCWCLCKSLFLRTLARGSLFLLPASLDRNDATDFLELDESVRSVNTTKAENCFASKLARHAFHELTIKQ